MAKISPFFDRVGQHKKFPLLSPTRLRCLNDRKDLSYKIVGVIQLRLNEPESCQHFSEKFSLKCDS